MLESKFLRTICKIAGTLLTGTSLWLTACFGLSISIGMMLGLAVIAFMSAYLPAILIELSSTQYRNVFRVGLAVALVITVIDVTTNVSTGGAHKTSDVVQAHVQQTKYEDNRANVEEMQNKLKFLEARQKQLEGHAGWTGTKPAAAFDGEIAAKEEAVAQEARRGGCGPKCLALKQELAELQANQAVAAEHERNAKMLAATVEGLQKTRAAAATVDRGESAVETQNVRLASLFTLSRDPDEGARHWVDQWLAVLFGLGITAAAQFFNALAWVSDRPAKAFMERFAGPQTVVSTSVPVVPQTASVPAVPRPERVVERIVEKPSITVQGTSLLDAHLGQLGWVNRAGAAGVAA